MPNIAQLPAKNFYCRLKLNDIDSQFGLLNLTIRESVLDILPRIEIRMTDDGYINDQFPIQDNQIAKVIIGKNEDDPNPLEASFILSDWNQVPIQDMKRVALDISGYLLVDNMFTEKHRCFAKANSEKVIRQIASEAGLKFSNPQNTVPSDNMTWYQIHQSNYDFIKHVLKRTFTPDDVSFCYTNTDSEMIYTSLNREMNKQDVKIAKYGKEGFDRERDDETDPDKTIWYNKWDISQRSGYMNRRTGYGVHYTYYDLKKEVTDVYSNMKKITSLTFKDKDLFEKPVHTILGGMFNKRNIYDDYFESLASNIYLVDSFFGYSLLINVNALSKVKLMDKINLSIKSMTSDGSNDTLSGFYLVGSICHQIINGGTYLKTLSLNRNGMNKSSVVQEYKVA